MVTHFQWITRNWAQQSVKNAKKNVPKGELRIGKRVPFKVVHIIQYFHVNCAFASFQKARISTNVISNTEDIDGINAILEEDNLRIGRLVSEINTKKNEPSSEVSNDKKKRPKFRQGPSKLHKEKLESLNVPALKVMFTNADQLTPSKMVELKKQIEIEKPLIVAVSEVKSKNYVDYSTMDYNIPGFSLHPVNLDTNIGRGIAVYTKEELDKSAIQIDSDLSFEEACLLEIRLGGGDKLLFACCYRSPTPSETSEKNNERLNQLLKYIAQKKYSHRCIVGDLNFKDINWSTWTTVHGENSVEATFIDVIRDCFYYQHVEEATRRRGNDNPSLLDLVLTDEQMQVSEVLHHAPMGKSDHDLITFQFHCYLDFAKPKEKYDFSKGDYQAMRENLGSSTWIQDYMEDNEETSVERKMA